MAYIFSLSVECGSEQKAADALSRHFDGLVLKLANGTMHRCSVRLENFEHIQGEATRVCSEGWWAIICPDGVSTCGIQNEHDRAQMTEIGFKLYDRLRTAPVFRFALLGVEAEGFAEYSDLDSSFLELNYSGLVLEDAIWARMGSSAIFEPFAHGYHWWPFVRAH